MDKIILKNAKLNCSIGVTKKERRKKQLILVDAELFLDLNKASRTDNIKYTINYSHIYKSIKNAAEKKEYNLIEALVGSIAKEILSNYPIKKIIVGAKKNISYAEYAFVEIMVKKNG